METPLEKLTAPQLLAMAEASKKLREAVVKNLSAPDKLNNAIIAYDSAIKDL